MTPFTSDSILKVLQQELETQKQRHQEAKKQFWKVTGQSQLLPGTTATVPQDLVRRAIAEETAARRAHLDALIRINDYLIRGKIPDHLQEKQKRQA